jgi:hypothetical protein
MRAAAAICLDWRMSRPGRSAPFIVGLALCLLAATAWAAGGRVLAPGTAKVGATITIHASRLVKGSYALTLVSDSHPARGVSCVARLSRSRTAQHGSVTLRGTVPRQLTCYQGLATSLGAVPTATGRYHLVVAEPTAPAGFDARASFVRSALHLTR